MIEHILDLFPADAYLLTVVSDPDGVLADEQVLAALSERGFRLVNEPDPVHLRHRVEAARPFRTDRPLIVVTTGPLEGLPYDLWQQGQHVTLALHTFFPNLAYPVVRALSPAQRWRLAQSPSPPRRLGQRATVAHILRYAFAADLDAFQQPARLIAWLDSTHRQADPMPSALAAHLLECLQSSAAYTAWPLEEMLTDREAFTRFVSDQWLAYVQQQTGQLLSEAPVRYLLPFERDGDLQDTVPGLVRSGTLEPLAVENPRCLPRWARPALLEPDENRRPRRLAELLEILAGHLETDLSEARWEAWQSVARDWAELNSLRHAPDLDLDETRQTACRRIEGKLDAAFLDWLRQRYAPLGGQRLPAPHHLHHVPHYLAYLQRQGQADRIALLILDGLSLEDWTLIGPVWRARHPGWRLQEGLLLAQIPTITEVSRHALVGGLRPADLPPWPTSRNESRLWSTFWGQQGLPAEACACVHIAFDGAEPPAELESIRLRAICLTDGKIDDMVHNTSLGAADFQASLRLWLEGYGKKLEEMIDGLLARGFSVYVTSDHGHVEAQGMGQPSEGLTVQTRGKRARIYNDRQAAANVQNAFAQTILWSGDGLLSEDVWVLMPQGRRAFALVDEIVVTHGGPILDEVVVPLVTITLA
ncbi:MAG: BREX-3 system phosphatase PglZ [Anaerolineae bacterium]|nr:BREX-3 system phosphatase PglZ [Anaerolineae bacterium]